MADDGFNLPGLLKGFGISTESLDRIRLGRGAVGRVTTVALGVLGVLGVAAWKAESEWLRIGAAAAAFVLFIIFLFKVLNFAEKNPGLSLLDGADLINWRRLDLAAKDMPEPPQTPSIPEIEAQSQPLVAPPTEDEPESET